MKDSYQQFYRSLNELDNFNFYFAFDKKLLNSSFDRQTPRLWFFSLG